MSDLERKESISPELLGSTIRVMDRSAQYFGSCTWNLLGCRSAALEPRLWSNLRATPQQMQHTRQGASPKLRTSPKWFRNASKVLPACTKTWKILHPSARLGAVWVWPVMVIHSAVKDVMSCFAFAEKKW